MHVVANILPLAKYIHVMVTANQFFFSNSCLLSNERILLLKVHYCFKNLANEKLIAIDKLFNIKIVY